MTEHLCVTCPVLRPADAPRIPDDGPVCNGDQRSLRTYLSEIPDLYAQLDATPGRSSAEKVSGSREAPLPLRVDPLDLTMPARQASAEVKYRGDWSHLGGDPDQVGHLSVATELDFWVTDWRAWRDRGEHPPDPTVSALTHWLLVRLDDCWTHPAVVEFAGAVQRLVKMLRAIATPGGSGRANAGLCPEALRDGTRCSARLSADPYVDRITCPRTGTSWNRREGEWRALLAAQAEARKIDDERARSQQTEWDNDQGVAA